jgi:crotonobetainyl-CoA:carnitine CoA-transferase CaiB-like acyl-CoA transferase
MFGGQVALLTYQAGRYLAFGEPPKRIGNRHASIAPYETYHARDGFVNIACGNDSMWPRFCKALGFDDLLADVRFAKNADRVANRPALNAQIEPRLVDMTVAEVIAKLGEAGVPAGPVFTLDQVFADPQAEHLRMAQPTPHPKVADLRTTGVPYQLSETPAEVRLPPPLLGQHTAEVLREVGYDEAAVARLSGSAAELSR